jgi:hypothetical protein
VAASLAGAADDGNAPLKRRRLESFLAGGSRHPCTCRCCEYRRFDEYWMKRLRNPREGVVEAIIHRKVPRFLCKSFAAPYVGKD